MQGQDYKTHVRWDQTFHFVAMPLALIGLVGMVVHLIQQPSWLSVLFVIAALALLLTVAKLRMYGPPREGPGRAHGEELPPSCGRCIAEPLPHRRDRSWSCAV